VTSISRKLILWLAIPLSLLALCGGLLHYFNVVAPQVLTTDRLLKEAQASLHLQVDLVAGEAQVSADSPTRVRFAVRDRRGALLAGDPALPATIVADSAKSVYRTADVGGHKLRLLAEDRASVTGPLTVTVAAPVGGDQTVARYGLMSTLLWDFVYLDITLILVWVGIQVGLRPVLQLRDEVAERSPQDLRPLVAATAPRELAPLVSTLNRLFATLRSSVQSQQQFIANTAHQLRTPITAMLAQLESLAAEPEAEPIKQQIAGLQEGVRQLARSANQLLTLARADPAVNLATKRELVALDALAREVVAKFLDRAVQGDIDLGADLRPVWTRADPSLLDDLLSNLIDNALKYTPAGGSVTLSTGELAGQPFLSVEDTGPGIPPADRARVRERFVRLPNSPGHGSGLGLAIVEEIAKLFDATLSIDAGANQRGTKISVLFPAAAGAAAATADRA
jgi:two-component system sensor histidine kinase TctE